jgi:hypothetical protein
MTHGCNKYDYDYIGNWNVFICNVNQIFVSSTVLTDCIPLGLGSVIDNTLESSLVTYTYIYNFLFWDSCFTSMIM